MKWTSFENWIRKTVSKTDSQLIKSYKYHSNRNEAEAYKGVIRRELIRRGISIPRQK